MARIRSIKPEFFTSETLAAVSLSARLTFIGMWTYVDDNGVGIDNERLIAAALYALDPDPLETLRRVSEDLKQLSTQGVITRYEVAGRHYVFITNWLEHQKVTHPGKPRYPRPAPGDFNPPTSGNGNPHESLTRSSGESPESLTRSSPLSREQGAGSREQGIDRSPPATVTRIHPDRADEPEPLPGFSTAARPRPARADLFDAFWKIYPRKKGKAKAESAWTKRIDEGIDPQLLIEGAVAYQLERKGQDPAFTKHPATWLNQGCWQDEPDPPYAPPADTPGNAPAGRSGPSGAYPASRAADDYGGDAHMARFLARAEAREAAGERGFL